MTTCASAPRIYGGIFDYAAKAERLRTVNAALEDPAVWNDPKKAQELGKEKKSLDDVVVVLDALTQELTDSAELYEMSRDEGDDATLEAIESETLPIRQRIETLEFRRMFNQPADPNNCFLDIQAGVDCDRLGRAVELILSELAKTKEKPVDAQELRRAKDYAIGQLRLGLESTSNPMMWVGENLMSYGRFIQPSERLRIPVSSRPMVCAVVGGSQRSATSSRVYPLARRTSRIRCSMAQAFDNQIGFHCPT